MPSQSLPGTPILRYRALRPTDESTLPLSQRGATCVSRSYQMPTQTRGLVDPATQRIARGVTSLSRTVVVNAHCKPRGARLSPRGASAFHEADAQGCPDVKDDCCSDEKSDSVSTTDCSEHRTSVSMCMYTELKKLSERISAETATRELAFAEVFQLLQRERRMSEDGWEKLEPRWLQQNKNEATTRSVIEEVMQSQMSAIKNELQSEIEALTSQQHALSNRITSVQDDLNKHEATVYFTIDKIVEKVQSQIVVFQNDLFCDVEALADKQHCLLNNSVHQARDNLSKTVDAYWRDITHAQDDLAKRFDQLDRDQCKMQLQLHSFNSTPRVKACPSGEALTGLVQCASVLCEHAQIRSILSDNQQSLERDLELRFAASLQEMRMWLRSDAQSRYQAGLRRCQDSLVQQVEEHVAELLDDKLLIEDRVVSKESADACDENSCGLTSKHAEDDRRCGVVNHIRNIEHMINDLGVLVGDTDSQVASSPSVLREGNDGVLGSVPEFTTLRPKRMPLGTLQEVLDVIREELHGEVAQEQL